MLVENEVLEKLKDWYSVNGKYVLYCVLLSVANEAKDKKNCK